MPLTYTPMRIERALLHGVGVFDELLLEFPAGADANKADVYLFTGPNGCGKSTILYALAAGVGGMSLSQPELLTRRLAGPGAFVEVASSDDAAVIARASAPRPGADLLHTSRPSGLIAGLNLPAQYQSGDVVRYAATNGAFHRFELRASNQLIEAHDFAAFAYAGRPVLEPFQVDAIKELGAPPLAGSLRFHDSDRGADLAQWLANTRARAAFAEADGRSDLAGRYRQGIELIEVALSKALDEEIVFEFGYEPLSVRCRQEGRSLELDLLNEGAKSIVSWLADVYMRLDRATWRDDRPIAQREFLLLLDEVDIYLHPSLQRRLLPIVQSLFPRAQIIASTHSPFVVASATDAWVYRLRRDGPRAVLESKSPLRGGASYGAIVRDVFDIAQEFDSTTEDELDRFYEIRQDVLTGHPERWDALVARANSLAERGVEVANIVHQELRQVGRRVGRSPAA